LKLQPDHAPHRFSDKLREGFCLGCGGKTRWVRNHFKRFGKDGDSLNWHRACFARFRYRWTTGLEKALGYQHVCEVCGKRFTAAGLGAWMRKTCSEECRYERTLAIALARAKLHRSRPFPRQERACVVCGKLFPVGGGLGRWKKKTCSRACRNEQKRRTTAAWRKTRVKPLSVQKCKCVICGKPFTYMGSKPGLRKTCSISCRYQWHRQRHAAWEKDHPGRKKKHYVELKKRAQEEKNPGRGKDEGLGLALKGTHVLCAPTPIPRPVKTDKGQGKQGRK